MSVFKANLAVPIPRALCDTDNFGNIDGLCGHEHRAEHASNQGYLPVSPSSSFNFIKRIFIKAVDSEQDD